MLRRAERSGDQPIAVRMVYEASQAVKIPVIGIGGISTPEDVVEFLLAGATAVEVGTANFWIRGLRETGETAWTLVSGAAHRERSQFAGGLILGDWRHSLAFW